MPKRTNSFQKLVAFIEKQLAPVNATVTESAMVSPVTGGEPSEIDILIESRIGNHQVKIAVECRAHKRKQNKNWIEELKGKYEILPIDHVVAVSNSGFTKGAYERAKLANINVLTMDEALSTDWPESFTKWAMGLIVWHHSPVSAEVNYASEQAPEIPGDELKNCKITNRSRTIGSTLEQDVLELHKLYGAMYVKEWADENLKTLWESGEGHEWDLNISFNAQDRYLIAPNGNAYQISELIITLRCHFEFRRVKPRYYTYNRSRLTNGQLEHGGERYNFTLLHNKDGTPNTLNIRYG